MTMFFEGISCYHGKLGHIEAESILRSSGLTGPYLVRHVNHSWSQGKYRFILSFLTGDDRVEHGLLTPICNDVDNDPFSVMKRLVKSFPVCQNPVIPEQNSKRFKEVSNVCPVDLQDIRGNSLGNCSRVRGLSLLEELRESFSTKR